MPTLRAIVLGFTIAMTAAACGGGDSTDPLGGENTGRGTISATIDGAQWSAAADERTSYSTLIGLFIAGTSGNKTMVLGAPVAAPGTIHLGPGNDGTAAVISFNPAGEWGTEVAGTTGTVTVTTLTSNHAVGTFSFDAKSSDGSSTMHVVNGKFDVTF